MNSSQGSGQPPANGSPCAPEAQDRGDAEDASCDRALARWQERVRARYEDWRRRPDRLATPLAVPLRHREALAWCRDLEQVARGHGWHPNDAVFLQFGRFCVYVRGAGHRKLLHPVVLAPKQDFLSLVPIVCPPGHLTYLDAQAVTDAVASDPAIARLVGSIYCFANSCEQVRNRSLPPEPLPDVGLSAEAAQALEERIAQKVSRLQDLADSTTRLLSAVYNGVSPQIVLDGPVTEIRAAVEDLVGSRLAATALPTPALVPGAADTPPATDPLGEVWNDVAALQELVQSRLMTADKQRRLSAAAEALQARIIRLVEASLPAAGDGPEAPEGANLDAFSEAVVTRVNFGRLRQAVADLRQALPQVLDPASLSAEAAAVEQRLAQSVGPERARTLRDDVARTVECERAVDRAVDRLLEAAATDAAAATAEREALQRWVVAMVGAEEGDRLIAPLREALPRANAENGRQELRDHGIGLLLALSSRGESRLETLFTTEGLTEEDAWLLQKLHRILVGQSIAACARAAAARLEETLAAVPVSSSAILADKQVLWGLAYEILSWAETRRVAAAVATNAQPFEPAHGTFAELRLASGEALRDLVAQVTGLTESGELALPIVAEAPLLLSASGEMVVPERSLKVIGGITDVGTFRLSRRVTRWNVADAATLLACTDDPFWVACQSALGSVCPAPAAIVDALDCAHAAAAVGGPTEVWCGVLTHPEGDAPEATLRVYRPDASRAEPLREAARACDQLLSAFDHALEARLEELEGLLRSTGYAPARLMSRYREVAASLKEFVRTFAHEQLSTLAREGWLMRAAAQIDEFTRFATRALQEAQRQGLRLRQQGTRALITALYAIDSQRVLLRHRLHGLVRDAAAEERLLAPGLLTPVQVRLAYDAGETESLPLSPAALAPARWAAFVAACAGPEADEEQTQRAQALCALATSLLGGEAEPGPAAALLLDFLHLVQTPLFARERSRPVLSPETFDAFTRALAARRSELRRYLELRPADAAMCDAVFLALVIREMAGRWPARLPLWEPVVDALRRGASICGQPAADLIHLSDAEEAAALLARFRSGDLIGDARLVNRLTEEAARELHIDLHAAAPDGLAYARDDVLALLHQGVARAAERLQPERDLFLRLAAGSLSEEEYQALQQSLGAKATTGKRDRKGRRQAGAAATPPADPEAVRARLADSARRYAECEHLAGVLAPYAEGTAGALYPFVLSTLAGHPAEVVRPSLSGMSPLPPAGASESAPAAAAPATEDAAEAPDAEVPGPVSRFLEEFEHLGHDALAADLVEAALVLFPNDEYVRETLAGSRKQVLDAILAREFPGVMKSTRMQIVVAAEPRGLRLHDISDLVKLVSEGGASPSEVRNLLRSV